jgi:hypothetical protein
MTETSAAFFSALSSSGHLGLDHTKALSLLVSARSRRAIIDARSPLTLPANLAARRHDLTAV